MEPNLTTTIINLFFELISSSQKKEQQLLDLKARIEQRLNDIYRGRLDLWKNLEELKSIIPDIQDRLLGLNSVPIHEPNSVDMVEEVVEEVEEEPLQTTTNPKKTIKLHQPLTPYFLMMDPNYKAPKPPKDSKRFLTPYFLSFSDKPVNELLQIGNFKFKENYKNAQEDRIFDPIGISPCLTRNGVPYVFIDGRGSEGNKDLTSDDTPLPSIDDLNSNYENMNNLPDVA